MTNRKTGIRLLTLLVIALAGVLTLDTPASAQAPSGQPSHAIREDSLPWRGWPWLVGVLFSGGALAVGFKNAKRSHMD